MAHDVFISHSSKDKTTADAICHNLEKNGVRCWIAPRDVPGGANYGAEIIRGIRGCTVFVLVFSTHSNDSSAVQKEVERAFSEGKTIIPFRLDDAEISDNLVFYIAGNHWLDAYPDDKVFKNLVETAKSIIGGKPASFNDSPIPSNIVTTPQSAEPSQDPMSAAPLTPIISIAEMSGQSGPSNTSSFQPVGNAFITLKDGQQYTTPANCILTRSWREVYDGIAPDYNPAEISLTRFSEMKSLLAGTRSEREYEFSITMLDGSSQRINGEFVFVDLVFLFNKEHYAVPFTEVESIQFDAGSSCVSDLEMLCVKQKDGESVYMPKGLFFIGHKKRPSPDAIAWVSGLNWTDSFKTDRGQTIPIQSLRMVKFLDVQLEADSHFDRWIKSCKAEFLLKDGRKLVAQIKMDSLDLFGIDDFGPMEIKVEDVEKIDFNLPNAGNSTMQETMAKKPQEGSAAESVVPNPPAAVPAADTDAFEMLFGGVLKKYTGSSREVSIPWRYYRIFSMAFDHCEALEKVIIPEVVTELDLAAFNHCVNLTSIAIEGQQVKIGSPNFGSCPKLAITCHRDSFTHEQLKKTFSGTIEFY